MRRFFGALCLFCLCNVNATEIVYSCQEKVLNAQGIYKEFLKSDIGFLTESYRYQSESDELFIGETMLSCKKMDDILSCSRVEADDDYRYEWRLRLNKESLESKFLKLGYFANQDHMIETEGHCKEGH